MHEGKEDKGRRNLETNECARWKERAMPPREKDYKEGMCEGGKQRSLSKAWDDILLES